jgi:L-fucose isomerase-like protein
MAAENPSVTLGVIVATRGFFNPELAANGRQRLLSVLKKLGIGAVIGEEGATPNGAVESLEDARRYAALFQAHRAAIDGILVSLPNFGGELGVVETLELSRLGVPVMVQAFDDDLDKVDVKHRRDAFCGKLSVCNNLYQYGIPWTDTAEHTCAVDGAGFEADLRRFAWTCRVVRGLTGARIGMIGARPAAFQTVRFSEKLLQKSGITVVPVDLSEVLGAAQRLDEKSPRVQEKLGVISRYGTIPDRIPAESVVRQARLSVAIDEWTTAAGCSASAIQCWDSVEANYGCATCLSMSLMGELERKPGACESDVAGAVSMLALTLATGNAAGLLDWNNNYGDNRELCVATHCSNFPRSFMGSEVEIAELDVLGGTLGRERCFGAVKGKVAPGPMTFFRLDTDDARGCIHAYLGEGEFTADPCDMDGGIAVCRVPGLRELMSHVTRNGFAHHVAMVRGHCAAAVYEATKRYLGWDVYWHGAHTT